MNGIALSLVLFLATTGTTVLSFTSSVVSPRRVITSINNQYGSRPSTSRPVSVELMMAAPKSKKALGLLTFDLDDSLYPIDIVLDEANSAFARAMDRFGFSGIKPSNIAETCKKIREELPPSESIVLTHTEVRTLAIRREMEQVIYTRKLKETADDWATPINDLSPIVKNFASKWATEAVSESIVQAVLNSWEMERHHAAERNLYEEVLPALEQIRASHPEVIIGAVTDGKANPLLMTFTLANYFDFCLSWEDDQAGRKKFFQDLANVEGNAELKWIYDAALEKYQELRAAQIVLQQQKKNSAKTTTTTTDKVVEEAVQLEDPINSNDRIWIHVGDDLAYDVGGSFQSGAKTIWLELDDEKYHQTARQRFASLSVKDQPSWSTSGVQELEKRRVMNALALQHVDKRVRFFSQLPEAIQEIVDEANEEDEEAMKAVERVYEPVA